MMAFGVSRVVTDGGVRAGGEAELEWPDGQVRGVHAVVGHRSRVIDGADSAAKRPQSAGSMRGALRNTRGRAHGQPGASGLARPYLSKFELRKKKLWIQKL
jgi:hypothetical protein